MTYCLGILLEDGLVLASDSRSNAGFDQIVEVKPRSGGLLTAVGAIAGGPVGAAVGAVANAVLDKPMRGIGAKTYRVTGPWASPKVETISHAASAQVEAEQTRSDPARDEQGHVD